MNILLLNQYAPPDPAPTARLLGDLALSLKAKGHAVQVIAFRQSYWDHHRQSHRLLRELRALMGMMLAGLRSQTRADLVVCLSSPPGLLFAAAMIAKRHRVPVVHWAMDLYPELAVALQEIKPGSVAAHLVHRCMAWAYQQASLVIALDEDMRAYLQARYRVQASVLAPWAFSTAQPGKISNPPPTNANRFVYLYSGNLGRAHEWETLLNAQRLLEQRGLAIDLVFQGGGPAWPAARARADELGLQRCHWRDYVDETELAKALLSADVLIATQRPETKGFLWPSKLALLSRLPRPILWIGLTDGAVCDGLRERGNVGIFASSQAEAVADWIGNLSRASTKPEHSWKPSSLASEKEIGCTKLERWFTTVASRGFPPVVADAAAPIRSLDKAVG